MLSRGKELVVSPTETALTAQTNGPHRSAEQSFSVDSRTATDVNHAPWGVRHRLPAERASLTHHFTIGQHDGYLTVGLFSNGEPGEIFVSIAKEGSTLGGLMDSFAKAIS